MPNFVFGSIATSVIGFTDDFVYTASAQTIAAARVAANGNGPQLITALGAYVSGRTASRTIVLSLGSAVTGGFTRASAASAGYSGQQTTNSWYVANGTTATFTIDGNGSFYFGRGGASTSTDSYGTSFAGTLYGSVDYIQVPTAPTLAVASTTTPGQVSLTVTAPGDNGGSAVTGYSLVYADNVGFTGSITTTIAGSTTLSGLATGKTWYFKLGANNAVTTAAATTSAYSSTVNVYLASVSGSGQIVTSYGIGVNASGTVYVSDFSSQTVTYYDSSGNYVGFFGASGTGNGQFNSPRGITFIPSSQNPVVVDSANSRIQVFDTAGVYVTQVGAAGAGNGQFSSPQSIDSDATFLYVTDTGNSRVQRFTQAAPPVYSTQWGTAGTGDGQFTTPRGIAVRPSNGNVYVVDSGNNRVQYFTTAGVYTGQFGSVGTTNGLFTSPIAIAFDTSSNVYVSDGLRIQKFDSSHVFVRSFYVPYAVQEMDFLNKVLYCVIAASTAEDKVYALRMAGPTLSDAISYYAALVSSTISVTYSAATNPIVTLPPFEGNVWDYLKQLCSAYGVEISAVSNVLTVRDVGSATLSLSNVEPESVQLSLQSQATGRSVDFKNYNAISGSGLAYNAVTDDLVLQVEVAGVVSSSIKTTNYVSSITSPIPTNSATQLDGTYYVTDSLGGAVSAAIWTAAGGSLVFTITDTTLGTLAYTLTGPANPIVGFTAPFYLATLSSGIRTPRLTVVGSGVFTTPTIVNIRAGTDETKTTQEVAFSVDNFAHANIATIQIRSTWALTTASGPAITLSATVPTLAISGFGVTPGAVITYKDSKYRVDTVSVGNEWTRITASRYATVGDIDAIWGSQTVGNFDALWGTKTLKDFKIKPLRTS